MGSSTDEKHSNKLDEKHDHHVEVSTKQVDTAAELAAGDLGELDPVEADRVRYVSTLLFEQPVAHFSSRKKIDRHILPLMCSKCQVGCVHHILTHRRYFPVLYWSVSDAMTHPRPILTLAN